MLAYEVFVHVRQLDDHADIHTSKYQANARHTYSLLRAIDPAVAHKFAMTYDLPDQDKQPYSDNEAHP